MQNYLDFPTRLSRLETQIIKEASLSGNVPLSDTVALIWAFLAGFKATENSKKYIRSIGNILTSLDPVGLWKLTVVTKFDRDVFVQINDARFVRYLFSFRCCRRNNVDAGNWDFANSGRDWWRQKLRGSHGPNWNEFRAC